MTLAKNYASVLKTIAPKQVVAFMKMKGHLSLLPQVLRILERERGEHGTVAVAKEEDKKNAARLFPGAEVVVDSRIVGGYVAKIGGVVTDATYRKALVTVYKNATK